jgi:hypothetical protein
MSRSRNSAVRSISDGGQPWKVLSVTLDATSGVNGRSAYPHHAAGISRRSRSIGRPRVPHPADERLHAVARDAVEGVADAQVEREPLEPGGQAQPPAGGEHLDQHRRLHVLVERLLERQLLRPLDVEADRPHVDARPRHGDPVVRLHRLQLDDSAAGEP